MDEDSPLSAPDLRRVMDRLHLRSLHVKDRVLRLVLSHHHHFAHLFSLSSSASSLSESLSSDLSRALDLLSLDPPDAEIRDLVLQIIAARRELDRKREALKVVDAIAGMVERIEIVRGDLKSGEIVRAAEGIRVLKQEVEDVSGDGDEPEVFRVLRKEVARCFDELQEALAGLVEKAVCFDKDSRSVKVASRVSVDHAGEVELQLVLEALEMVGVLDYGLAKPADLIFKSVMVPVISEDVDVFVEECMGEYSDFDHHLKLIQPSNSQEREKVHIYSRLIEVITYVRTFVCCENAHWIRSFGRLTWSRVAELIITHFLSKVIPEDASKIAEFEDVVKYTVEFEEFLKNIKFISEADSNEEKLSCFARNVEVHFAVRKRNEILAKARQMILQCEFVSSPENDADLLFQPEKCTISKAATQLMELIHLALQDVCVSSAKVAMELYHAARDALLLYEAIVPVKLAKQLETTGLPAIIIHNDFLYLSQETAGLAFEYRPYFPSAIKEVPVFVDVALYFRQLSDDILRTQIQLVSLKLKEAIDSANGFQNTHQMQQYDLAKFTIDQVVFILEKVRIIWEPLLPKSLYKQSMCRLLDFVFANITNDILLLDDLAAHETLQLQRLIHMTIENSALLIESVLNDVQEKDMLPSLLKFRKLADLLDMPLRSITEAWENGDLINFGFSSSEVVNFIKATFTESPFRKKCLWQIEGDT